MFQVRDSEEEDLSPWFEPVNQFIDEAKDAGCYSALTASLDSRMHATRFTVNVVDLHR